MCTYFIPTLTKATLVILLLGALGGCSSADLPSGYSVAQAYESSGTVTVPPYTRTIFSGTNF